MGQKTLYPFSSYNFKAESSCLKEKTGANPIKGMWKLKSEVYLITVYKSIINKHGVKNITTKLAFIGSGP